MPSRKRKLPATEAEPFDTIKFEASSCRDDNMDSSLAALVSFTNAQLVSDDGMEFAAFQDKNISTSRFSKKHIVAETEDMTYIGHNTGMFSANPEYMYVIGISDRTTKTCKLYSSQSYILNPILDGKDNKGDEEEMETNRQKIDALTSAFGNIRKKKTMEARHQNVISGDNLVDTIATVITESPNVANSATPGEKDSRDDIIPPYNLEAGSPAAAYPFDKIITNEMMSALISNEEELDTNETPAFLQRHLKHLPTDKDLRAQRQATLVYLYHLMRLFKLTYKEQRQMKDFLPANMPAIVKRQISQQFFVKAGNRPSIPMKQKDSLLAYILVLALHIEGFKMVTASIADDLKVPQAKLNNHLRILGCSLPISKTKAPMAELKVPLKLGEPPGKRARKR